MQSMQECYDFQEQPPEVFLKKSVLKNFANFTEKNLCWILFLIMQQAFRSPTLLKETPTQLFSCKICDIFKNTFSYREPLVAASVQCTIHIQMNRCNKRK